MTSLTEEKNRVDSGWLKKITVRVQDTRAVTE